MEKVKLTQEQADAIERGIKIYGKSRIMNDHALDGWVGNLNDLNGLTKDEIARALYVGYEVESEFKSGDYVVNDIGTIGLIESVNGDHLKGVWIRDFDIPMNCTSNKIARHATPEEVEEVKERRWWAKHGRDV